MSSVPSLSHDDNSNARAQRERILAWARSRYTWAHSHTYKLPDGDKVLAPIATLSVDDTHPFPPEDQLSIVQILELLTSMVTLADNLIVCVANVAGLGSVRLDAPPSSVEHNTPPEAAHHHGLSALAHDFAHAVQHLVDDGQSVLAKGAALVNDIEEAGDIVAEAMAFMHAIESSRSTARELSAKVHARRAEKDSLTADLRSELIGGIGHIHDGIQQALTEPRFESILTKAGLWGPARSKQDFAAQFQTIVPPGATGTPLSDDDFVYLRLAGPNPLLIQRVEALPALFAVDPARCETIMGEPLDQAIAAGRTYIVDYKALEPVIASASPAGQKFISAAFALFVLNEDRAKLRPVAIQCTRQRLCDNRVFYPDDGELWEQAKLHVQSADGNYHETISHLGLTHFLIEPFVVATLRNLPPQHPIHLLLAPHFQGTLFINYHAVVNLIRPGGMVDQLLAGTIESDWALSATALGNLDFNAHMLPNNLRARGVHDVECLPNYPYRDDALLIWNAIEHWISSYLTIYYKTDSDVVHDSELAAWYEDLVSADGGRLKGLGEHDIAGNVGISTREYLTQVLTMVVFTASAQHAAVNFPQLDIMSYTPRMPLAMYAPPPTTEAARTSTLAHYPPLQMTMLQTLLGQQLGSVYFTRLGDYDRHSRGHWFQDSRVTPHLAQFRQRLREVEDTIEARNFQRPRYRTLLPSRIPQSINI